jgi:hypothetical protein
MDSEATSGAERGVGYDALSLTHSISIHPNPSNQNTILLSLFLVVGIYIYVRACVKGGNRPALPL